MRTFRAYRADIRATYASPLGWLALVVLTGVLAYGGGGVMYWFHAIFRGEVGPDVPHAVHWALDSTIGFAGLLPAMFLIMPVALRLARPDARWAGSRAIRTMLFVGAVGALFALSTGPGPFLHNLIAGPTTPLGRFMTRLFDGTISGAAQPHSAISEGLLQVAVGLPTYVAATGAGVWIIGIAFRLRRRTAVQLPQAA